MPNAPEPAARRIAFDRREALHGLEATRDAEGAASANLPPHTLMARAGLSVARLARALQPHARSIWVACGPGNNGGDGLVAAAHLHRWARSTGSGARVVATHGSAGAGAARPLPPDARDALEAARAAGVEIRPDPPSQFDLAIDAVLGIGVDRPISGALAPWLALLRGTPAPVLCVDLPSGLDAETGALQPLPEDPARTALGDAGPRHTLSLLTLKPGLFTADGRDAAGDIWMDGLQVQLPEAVSPMAWLHARTPPSAGAPGRPHASHKGIFGDVAVVGGQDIRASGEGMTGAALLAARASLHAGAGRVVVGLLGARAGSGLTHDPIAPELMLRTPQRLLASDLPDRATLVCGCGGGEAVADILPAVLTRSPRLVLDADALNAIARDSALQAMLAGRADRGWTTVLTPHPLEAARLLGTRTADVMKDRLRSARQLADRFGAICVLKGSGTVLAEPGQVPLINGSGNGRLATAGTGDVLAGMIGAALAAPPAPSGRVLDRVANAVFQHGWLADHWEVASGPPETLSAGRLARRVGHLW